MEKSKRIPLPICNGEPIPREAVQFEFDRLVKFYESHGMSHDDIKKNLEKLMERAQEQAIGAKLLLARAEQLDMPVDEKAIDAQVENVIRQLGGRENYMKAGVQRRSGADGSGSGGLLRGQPQRVRRVPAGTRTAHPRENRGT